MCPSAYMVMGKVYMATVQTPEGGAISSILVSPASLRSCQSVVPERQRKRRALTGDLRGAGAAV